MTMTTDRPPHSPNRKRATRMTTRRVVAEVPSDVELEYQVLGAILHRYATCTALRPEHCYRPANALILASWRRLGEPVGRYKVLAEDGDRFAPYLDFAGLQDGLEARQPGRGRRFAIYAGLLAARAPVTTRADVARLRLLAGQRHKLRCLEAELRRLLA